MKKLLFVFITMVFSAGMLVAQPQVFFGAGLGPHFSKLKFTSFKNEYSKDFYVGKDYTSTNSTNIHGDLLVGVKLGEKFAILVEPGFYLKNLTYETKSTTRETVRFKEDNQPATYTPNLEGNRRWTFKTQAIHVPVMARYNLIGDRVGLHLTGGFSINTLLGGTYNTTFTEITTDNVVNNNPIYSVGDGNGGIAGFINYSEEFPDGGDKLKFGKADVDHFNNLDISLLLGGGAYYNLNDDGTLRLTLDWRWDFGQINMYTKPRKDYLKDRVTGTKPVKDIDNPATRYDIIRTPVLISGSQKMTSGILTIGVEFCPSCGF